MKVLVIDIGGSHVKMLATGQSAPVRFDSDSHLSPDAFVARVRDLTADWDYDVVSLGYPGTVGRDGPLREPPNLGHGWVGFDFAAAFGTPVRVVNDAAMRSGSSRPVTSTSRRPDCTTRRSASSVASSIVPLWAAVSS